MSEEIALRPANIVDEKILSHAAAYSPTEISDILGGVVTPEEVYDRGKELLRSRNWLELAEQDVLVVHKLNRILVVLEAQHLNLDNAMAQVKILREIGTRLDKRAAATETDLQKLYGNQAMLMGQAIELAFQKMLASLREKYPEITDTEARDLMRESLPAAMQEIESRKAD